MASRLRKKKRGKKLLADEDDQPLEPAWPPLHAIHWRVGIGENKTRFLQVWLPDTDPDGTTFYYERYEARGATSLGSSRSDRYNTRFRGYQTTITKWGHDTSTGRFYFWDGRGMKYTALLNYRIDGKGEQQSEREIRAILRKVKKTSDFFEPPPESDLLHPLPGEPPVSLRPPPTKSSSPTPEEFEEFLNMAMRLLSNGYGTSKPKAFNIKF